MFSDLLSLGINIAFLYFTSDFQAPTRYTLIDSTYSMINYVSYQFGQNLRIWGLEEELMENPRSTLISSTGSFDLSTGPSISLIDRYLYYGLLTLTEFSVSILTANKLSYVRYCLFTILTLPKIQKWMLKVPLWISLRESVHNFIKERIQKVICVLFATIFNFVCEIALDVKPQLSGQEVSKMSENTDYETLMMFVRIFVFTNILEELKGKTAGNVVVPLMQQMYNYGQVLDVPYEQRYHDPFEDIPNPEDKIRALILKRRWDQLNNPFILTQLLHLYECKSPSTVNILLRRTWYQSSEFLQRLGAIWTVGILSSNSLASSALSLSLYLKRYLRKKTNIPLTMGISVRLLAALFGYFKPNLFWVVAISECGDILLTPRMSSISDFISRRGRQYLLMIRQETDVIFDSIITLSFFQILSFLDLRFDVQIVMSGFGLALSRNRVDFLLLAIVNFFSQASQPQCLFVMIILICFHVFSHGRPPIVVNPLIESYINEKKTTDISLPRIDKEGIDDSKREEETKIQIEETKKQLKRAFEFAEIPNCDLILEKLEPLTQPIGNAVLILNNDYVRESQEDRLPKSQGFVLRHDYMR